MAVVSARTTAVLKTLAEPHRVAILTLLKSRELPATKIAGRRS